MPRTVVLVFALAAGMFVGPSALSAQDANYAASLPAFEFHSGFWVNLHHFLYLQGRLRQGPAEGVPPAARAESAMPPVSLEELSPSELQAWNAAVSAYAADWSLRDLRTNDMGLINERLADLENCRELLEDKGNPQCIAGLRPEMIAALNEAAPIYRARWWPEQDRRNRAWITDVAPLVRRMGEVVGDELIAVYRRRWPPGALRVDVVGYAGLDGAYTTMVPSEHVMLSSVDPGNQGSSAFEVLFRQASEPLAEAINQAVAAECRKQEKPIPREFLQAMLSYTTGELVVRAFALEYAGTPESSYTPAAFRNGLFDGEWSGYREILMRDWQPYLQGRLTLGDAVNRMVSSW